MSYTETKKYRYCLLHNLILPTNLPQHDIKHHKRDTQNRTKWGVKNHKTHVFKRFLIYLTQFYTH